MRTAADGSLVIVTAEILPKSWAACSRAISSSGVSIGVERASTRMIPAFRLAPISSSKLIVAPVIPIKASTSEIARPMMEWTCNSATLIEYLLMAGKHVAGIGAGIDKARRNRRLFNGVARTIPKRCSSCYPDRGARCL